MILFLHVLICVVVLDEEMATFDNLDPWAGRTKFRKSLIDFYGVKVCMLSGDADPDGAHIWPFCTGGQGLSSFELYPQDLNNPRNGLLLKTDIVEAFELRELCFLWDGLRSCLVCHVYQNARVSVHPFHGCRLRCGTQLPFLSLLSFHATRSVAKHLSSLRIFPTLDEVMHFRSSKDGLNDLTFGGHQFKAHFETGSGWLGDKCMLCHKHAFASTCNRRMCGACCKCQAHMKKPNKGHQKNKQ
jgi:hypothetical protein